MGKIEDEDEDEEENARKGKRVGFEQQRNEGAKDGVGLGGFGAGGD